VHAYRDRLTDIAAVRSGELQARVWYSDPSVEDGVPGSNEAKNLTMYNLAEYHFAGRMDLPSAEKTDLDPDVLHLNEPTTQYCVCGPPGFMKAQMEGLASLGVDKSRINYEGFG
jgi:ferredoxin-NADP reductase